MFAHLCLCFTEDNEKYSYIQSFKLKDCKYSNNIFIFIFANILNLFTHFRVVIWKILDISTFACLYLSRIHCTCTLYIDVLGTSYLISLFSSSFHITLRNTFIFSSIIINKIDVQLINFKSNNRIILIMDCIINILCAVKMI